MTDAVTTAESGEPPIGGSILGTRVARVEDPRFLTTGGIYTANVTDPRLDGAVHAVFVRSPISHARIAAIDTSAATGAPGVAAVLTARDLHLAPPQPRYGTAIAEPYLADGVVRYVGQAVALVLAASPAEAVDAAELVDVAYEPLPAVVDAETAAADDVILFDTLGTNTAAADVTEPDPHFFDGCDVVVTQRIVNQRVAPSPLEGRAAAAVWSPENGRPRLTIWLGNQGAQLVKANLVAALGVSDDAVHVITPDVGGAFGAKFGAEPDHIVVAEAARLVGRPVRWAETRTENLTTMNHGRGQVQTVSLGGTRDGRMRAYRLDVLQDVGAYPRLAIETPKGTALMAPGVYDLARLEVSVRCVVTTTTPVGAFRGAGRPEATAAIERAVDLFAAEIGLDPAAVRRRNMIPAFTKPRTTLTAAIYDSGDFPGALDRVLAAADYRALRAEQAERRARRDEIQLGIGLSTYVEITGGGKENATVSVHSDGSATVFTGVSPHGQGHATAFAMLVSDRLGIPVDRITLVWGDTDLVPRGGGTGGSRSLQMGGGAVAAASLAVIDLAKERASALFEVDPADLSVDTARAGVGVAGVPEAFASFATLAEQEDLSAQKLFTAGGATFPFGAHLAVVEVDRATGRVHVRQLFAVDDAGTVLNPLLFDGQRHGGLAQGVSQALFEAVVFDADGNPLTATFADYGLPAAPDLPTFELLSMETATPHNPLGAKGIGEAATIGATPAVQNAVVDALAPWGVRHLDMPLTPPRVWRALRDAQRDDVRHLTR